MYNMWHDQGEPTLPTLLPLPTDRHLSSLRPVLCGAATTAELCMCTHAAALVSPNWVPPPRYQPASALSVRQQAAPPIAKLYTEDG